MTPFDLIDCASSVETLVGSILLSARLRNSFGAPDESLVRFSFRRRIGGFPARPVIERAQSLSEMRVASPYAFLVSFLRTAVAASAPNELAGQPTIRFPRRHGIFAS
jgi:hypothetical protein